MTEEVRFVHAADTHLGAPFAGVDATEPRVKEALRRATRDAFDRVVETCVERDADFLLLAGDVLDSSERDLAAHFAFQAGMERLAAAGIPVFVARGNHDPADGWSSGLDLPESVRFFESDRVERVTVEREGREVAAIYGRSFATRAVFDDFSEGFRRDPQDEVAVAVLHTNVGGRTEHEPYAPSRLEALRATRMDYWALGHIHRTETLSEDPAIAYSGSTQGLNPNEMGARGCLLVTLNDGVASLERVETAAVLWAKEELDLSDASSLESVRQAIRDTCEDVRTRSGGRPSIARLTLTGRTAIQRELSHARSLSDLLEDVRSEQMSSEPWIWVDRLADRTRQALDLDAVRLGQDLSGDLVRLADDVARDPSKAEEYVQVSLRPILERFGDVWDGRANAVEIVERARDACLDALGEDRS